MELVKTVFFIFLFVASQIQLTGQISFYKTYSGSAFDRGEGMTQLPDSSYAITGGSGAFSINSGQAYLMLTDSLGQHKWTKNYGGNGSDWGRRVFHKPGVGFSIAGTTNSTSDGRYNFYVITTDEQGDLLSENNFGTENWEQMWDAVLLSDGGMIMVGESEGETTSLKDMYLARVDAIGDTVWTRTIATGADDVAYAVDTLNDTTVVIGGYSFDGALQNSILISFHINGTENWRNFYGAPSSTFINDIDIYDNQIYCGGGIVLDGEEDTDWWLLKTDDEGNEIGTATTPYNGEDELSEISIDSDTSLFIALESNSSDLNVFTAGVVDAFVLRFHRDLYFNNFSQGFSGENPDLINDMIGTTDGGTAFAGTCGDDRVLPALGSAVMIAKIGPGLEVTSTPDEGNDLVSLDEQADVNPVYAFPNPTSGKLFLTTSSSITRIELFDLTGKSVLNEKGKSEIDLTGLKNGVYLLRISSPEYGVYMQKISKR